MEQLTAIDALAIVAKRAQWCRENGESDMRNILHTVSHLSRMVNEGKSRSEIIAEFTDDDEGE